MSLKRKDHILQAIYRKWPSVCLFIICKIRGEKQTSTWNHSIGGYGTHGNGSQHCLKSRRKTENKVSFHINPFTYGNFAEKRNLKLVEGFWTLWCYKHKAVSTGCTLCGLLIQMPYISFQSSGMCRKEHFLTFTFRVLSSPLFRFSSLPQFFFLFSHLAGFILMGKVFRKAFRILGLDERKGKEGSGTKFSGKFSGQCYMHYWLFSLSVF